MPVTVLLFTPALDTEATSVLSAVRTTYSVTSIHSPGAPTSSISTFTSAVTPTGSGLRIWTRVAFMAISETV